MQKSLGQEDKIFYNELEEFWSVFEKIYNEALFGKSDISPEILGELMRVFPKSQKQYRYFINMEKMKDFVPDQASVEIFDEGIESFKNSEINKISFEEEVEE